MDAEEPEALAELRELAKRTYNDLLIAARELNATATKELSGGTREAAYDHLNMVTYNAALLRNLLSDTWQAAEREAERYHRLIEELEDAATHQ